MQNKKKILVVSDYYLPHWTGIVKGLRNLIDLVSDDFDVTVLSIDHTNRLSRKERINNYNIIRSGYNFTISRSKYSLSQIALFLLYARKTDYVLVNSPSANILPISVITKVMGKRLMIYHQGDLMLPKGIRNFFIERVFDISTLLSFCLADRISTYTKDYAEHSRVMKKFMYKTDTFTLPVIVSRKGKKIRYEEDLIKMKKNGYIIFGFAGRFVEEKGFDILFEAIKLLKNKKIHFVFAGETKITYEGSFEKNKGSLREISERITFLGLLDDKQMSSYYNLIDCILIPSRSDCFNLVQAEAMLAGRPSIVSNIPGARYLVRESGFGLLFRPGDAHDLARNISKFTSLTFPSFSSKKLRGILDNKKNAEKFKQLIKGRN